MRTSFHHQPEAQHPKSPAIETLAGSLPHLWVLVCVKTPLQKHWRLGTSATWPCMTIFVI